MFASYLQGYLLYTAIIVCTLWFLVRRARSTREWKLPPGPPGWPIIGNLQVLFQDPEYPNGESYFMRRAREYGEIYKLEYGPHLVYVLSNSEHLREVLTHNKITGRLDAVAFKKAFGPGASGLAFASGPEWAAVSKFTKKLFRELGVGKGIFEERINVEIDRFVRTLGVDGKPCSDVVELLNLAAANTVCGVIFGQQYEYEDREFKTAVGLIESFGDAVGPSGSVMTSRLLCALPFGPGRRLVKCMRDFKGFLGSKIREIKSLMKEGEAPASYVKAFLLQIEKVEKHFDEDNLFACCMELFIAGTESTAAHIAWAIFFLATHPEVQRRCQQELDDLVEDLPSELPCYADRLKLPYLQATLHESVRLSTTGPLALPHVVDEDLKLYGYDFPKGTSVLGNFRAIYLNEEKYPEPRQFIPERFLKDGHFEADKDIIPFSIGPHTCPGAPLSKMEVFLYVVNLLHTFTIELPENTEMPDITLGRSAGSERYPQAFTVIFKKRQK